MTVKDNQPSPKQTLLDGFEAPASPLEMVARQENLQQATSCDKGHGRVEVRRIETLTQLPPSLSWPGVQVCRLTNFTASQQTLPPPLAFVCTMPKREN